MFDLSHIIQVSYSWGAAAAGLISLAGQYMSSRKKKSSTPAIPQNDWIAKYGPEMWNKLKGSANQMIDNPYGIPQDIRNRMYSTARNTAEAGYGAANRTNNRTTALAGLSTGGGDASRRNYYAGQQMAEGLNSAYGGIDIQDYLAREDQRNRGYNMMFSLSNQNPIYSQIASQNYWNALKSGQESGVLLAGAAGNVAQLFGNAIDNPYKTNSTTRSVGASSYRPGNYDPYSGYNNPNPPSQMSEYTDQGYPGYSPYTGGN